MSYHKFFAIIISSYSSSRFYRACETCSRYSIETHVNNNDIISLLGSNSTIAWYRSAFPCSDFDLKMRLNLEKLKADNHSFFKTLLHLMLWSLSWLKLCNLGHQICPNFKCIFDRFCKTPTFWPRFMSKEKTKLWSIFKTSKIQETYGQISLTRYEDSE